MRSPGEYEFSAGGIVLRGRPFTDVTEMLMIRVENLAGKIVWTFPKGHPDGGESAGETALREVEEETGWRCKITGRLNSTHYNFHRGSHPISKTVAWFLMEPLKLTGRPDADEIMKCEWVPLSDAARRVQYPADRKILGGLKILLGGKEGLSGSVHSKKCRA